MEKITPLLIGMSHLDGKYLFGNDEEVLYVLELVDGRIEKLQLQTLRQMLACQFNMDISFWFASCQFALNIAVASGKTQNLVPLPVDFEFNKSQPVFIRKN